MSKTDCHSLLIAQAKQGDTVAKQRLLEAYQGLIVSIARRVHFSDSADIGEAIQAGSIGLLEALRRFDLQKNVAFSTYAFPWILGEITRSMRRMSEQSALLESLELSSRRNPVYTKTTNYEASSDTNRQSVSVFSQLHSLDQPVSSDQNTRLIDLLPGGEEINLDRIALHSACAQLSEDERKVVFLRYFRDLTQSETATLMRRSQAQISRIESRSLERLRELLISR